jgi:hypothetical protein
MAERIGSELARTSALFIHAVTASISRTHSQCQRRGRCPYRGEPRIRFLHPWKVLVPLRRWRDSGGGASRDRTDDLKLAKLALSQLSYGPVVCRLRAWWAE